MKKSFVKFAALTLLVGSFAFTSCDKKAEAVEAVEEVVEEVPAVVDSAAVVVDSAAATVEAGAEAVTEEVAK